MSVLLILLRKSCIACPKSLSSSDWSRTSTSKISRGCHPFSSLLSFTADPPERVSPERTNAVIDLSVMVGPKASKISTHLTVRPDARVWWTALRFMSSLGIRVVLIWSCAPIFKMDKRNDDVRSSLTSQLSICSAYFLCFKSVSPVMPIVRHLTRSL